MYRTYVTGLWIVPNNAKRSPEHYFSCLPATFALLRRSHVIFYHDDVTVLEKALALAAEHEVLLEPIRAPLQSLACWGWAERFVDACAAMRLDEFNQTKSYAGEKGVVHFWRDLQQGGRESYISMLAIWLSKVPLVAAVGRRQNKESLAWIDASIARVNGERENWNFPRMDGEPGCISHYGNDMRFLGRRLPLSAGYLEGDSQAWQALEALYFDMLPKAARMPYGHDEETVLAQCVAEAPELFHCIGQPLPPWTRSLSQLRSRIFSQLAV